jgi:hypothetical protein
MAVKSRFPTQTQNYKPKLGVGPLIDAFILLVPSVEDQGLNYTGMQEKYLRQRPRANDTYCFVYTVFTICLFYLLHLSPNLYNGCCTAVESRGFRRNKLHVRCFH